MLLTALDRAIAQLEKTTGFGRAFDDLVVRRGGFPHGWLTPRKINNELTARGFWKGSRSAVHPDARLKLITRFLDLRVEQPTGQPEQEWKRFDGQYKLNPKTRLIDYRGAQQMSRGFDRRDHARLDMVDVHCQYGPVLNLSKGGLVFSTEKPKMNAGDRGYLRITHGQLSVRVKAKTIWVTPGEHGTHVGMDFRGLDLPAQQMIGRIMLAAAEEA